MELLKVDVELRKQVSTYITSALLCRMQQVYLTFIVYEHGL